MQLVYSFNTPHTEVIDGLCKVSNDLYNQSLYEWKRLYDDGNGEYFSYFQMLQHMKTIVNMDGKVNYYLTSSHSAQAAIKTVCDSIKAFFKAMKVWKKSPEKFRAMPQFPRYRKRGDLFNLVFTPQTSVIRDGHIISKKFGVSIPVPHYEDWAERLSAYKQVRIIPQRKHLKVEVVYRYEPQQADVDKSKCAAIDLGIDNLVTMATEDGCEIWSGKFLKAYNQYFNKRKAHLMSIHNLQGHKGITNAVRTLYEKRDAYFDYAYHNISRQIINTLIRKGIGTLAVGYNEGWKTEVNIGKVNNQKFMSISHARLKAMLQYKCEMVGIVYVEHEEAYTSKCDALAMEDVCKHEEYKGKRVKRGLFRSSTGKLINADHNGALNIMRKVVGDSYVSGIVNSGHCLCPVKHPFFSENEGVTKTSLT